MFAKGERKLKKKKSLSLLFCSVYVFFLLSVGSCVYFLYVVVLNKFSCYSFSSFLFSFSFYQQYPDFNLFLFFAIIFFLLTICASFLLISYILQLQSFPLSTTSIISSNRHYPPFPSNYHLHLSL